MTLGYGLGLLFLGLIVTTLVFLGIFKAEQHFEKERHNEDTTTRDY